MFFLAMLSQFLYFALHITGIATFPKPLNSKEEKVYLEAAAAGDKQAKTVLVERNLRLVAHIVKKYYTSFREQEDLISIGTIGLIKAVNTFKPDRNTKFATYASRCIENAILTQKRFQVSKGAPFWKSILGTSKNEKSRCSNRTGFVHLLSLAAVLITASNSCTFCCDGQCSF